MKKLFTNIIFVMACFWCAAPWVQAQDVWTEVGTAIEGAADDGYGGAVSISADGTIVAASAPSSDAAGAEGSLRGTVEIFELQDGSWIQKGSAINGTDDGASFGQTVSLSNDGTTLAIGAPFHSSSLANAGLVEIYNWNSSTSDWDLTHSIDGDAEGDNLGTALSLSGDGNILAIGAPFHAGGGTTRGRVSVYAWDGTDWVSREDLDGATDNGGFGSAVSLDLDGDILAIGAPDNGANLEGQFTTYSWNSTNYTNTGTFDGAADENLGQRVSLSDNGDALAVSAINLFTGGASVSIYEYTTSWDLQETLTSAIFGDNFGFSLSISGDGSRLGIGANNNVTDNENGRAEIYEFDGTNWNLVDQEITGEASGDEAGSSLSLSQQGFFAAIGATLNDAGGADAGHVRVFQQGAPDTTPPTVELSTSVNDTTNTTPFQITITFSEEVTGFTADDLSLTNGTAGNLTTSNDTIFTADITATEDGEVTVDLAEGLAEDLAGNLNTAANQLKRVVDTTAPEAVIELVSEFFKDDPFEVYFGFDEETSTLEDAQIEVQNATASNLEGPTAFEDGFIYVVDITPDGSNQDIIIDLPTGVVTDAAGNDNLAAEQKVVTYDNTPPTVELSAQSPTNSSPFEVTAVLSEAVQEITMANFTVTNGTATALTNSDQLNYILEVSPDAEGTVTIEVAAGAIKDMAGNDNLASDQLEIQYDITAPTVEITTSVSGPTNTAPIPMTITFGEKVNVIDATDITIGNGTVDNLQTSDSISFTANLTPTEEGEVTIDIAEGVTQDLAGNGNTAATQLTVTYDTTAPVAEFLEVPEATNDSEFTFFISFGEEVTGFEQTDLEVVNGTISAFGEAFGGFGATITPTGEGNITLDVAAETATDLAGNSSEAATQDTVTYDATAPVINFETLTTTDKTPTLTGTVDDTEATIEVVIGSTTYTATNNADGNWTLSGDSISTPLADGIYNVTITATDAAGNIGTDENPDALTIDTSSPTVTVNDLITNNATPTISGSVEDASSNVESVAIEVNGESYSATMEGTEWSAEITTELTENAYDISVTATDALENSGTEVFTASLTIDLTRPTATIEEAPAETIGEAFAVTFNFSEDVTGFEEGDLTIVNGTSSNFSVTDAKTYTADITPDDNLEKDDLITISLAGNIAQDDAGNGNTAATEVSVTYSFKYSGGKGTADDPYLIANEEDLRAISDNIGDWGAHFKQTADITIEDTAPLKSIGYNIKPFTGIYNGDYKAIKSIHAFTKHQNIYNESSFRYFSLFGVVNGAIVKNLSLDQIKMDVVESRTGSDTHYFSGLVTEARNGSIKIENCRVTGKIKIKSGNTTLNVGGLIARALNSSVEIKNSFSDIEFTIGDAPTGVFTTLIIGGLVAQFDEIEGNPLINIINSYSSSDFNINGTYAIPFIGGIIGSLDKNFNVDLKNIYYAGQIKIKNPNNSSPGGIIGGNDGSSITTNNVYWDKDISGTENAIGGGDIGETFGYSTSKMREFSTYNSAGWDIESLDPTGENTTNKAWGHFFYYPYLTWQKELLKPFTVSGTVIDENRNPISNATVKLNTGFEEAITASTDNSGNFTVQSAKPGYHSLWVESTDDNYVTTYYGNTKNQFFQKLIFYDNTVTIQMIPKSEENNLDGTGRVKGNVVKSSGIFRMTKGRMLDGDPLAGVQVSLVRAEDNEILITVETDEDGEYEINGIPAGEFQILLNLTGTDVNLEGSTFDMDEDGTPLVISAAVSEEGVVFNIEDEVLGIENEIEVAVYPNPVRDFVNIQVPGNASIRVIDINGVVVKEEQFTDFIKLDIQGLHNNMYFLEIRNGSGKAMRKLIKK
ncbi:MAG: Ig-like domain-containing protein [Bacteroidota bacterium]